MPVTRSVAVDRLRPGMFVTDIGLSWFEHPFLSSRLGLLKDDSAIAVLKGLGVSEVTIDLARGIDIEAQPGEPLPPAPPSSEEPPVLSPPDESCLIVPPPVDQLRTLRFARKFFDQAVESIQQVMGAVSQGGPVDLLTAKRLAARLVNTVNVNGGVLRIVGVLKAYDEYTYTHCVNVAAMGVLFGKHLGLPDSQMEELGLAGLLHDVGKCLLPHELVNKPGALTEAEYEAMKRHTVLGWEYIKNQDGVPTSTALGVLQHHERMDGSGYPSSLPEKEIAGVSRILTVLDVYDALTSDRVYRKRLSPHTALRKLFEQRGGAFPSNVLDLFIKCVGLYPPSSVVQLKNGFYAVVVGHNEHSPAHPDVMIFKRADGTPVRPRRVGILKVAGISSGSGYEIARHVEPSEMPPPDASLWL